MKYLLEGSVRQSLSQVRIGVELVDASSGTEMWTEYYDRSLKDIFSAQDEMIRKVATTLDLFLQLQKFPNLQPSGPRTKNPEAFDDYLRDGIEKRQWAAKAIALDPEYATPMPF